MHSDLHFDCSVKLKMLVSESVSDIDSTESKGIRLPKLDVPVFDGNILNWRRFWEQFSVSIHERSSLADSLKDGSAKGVIEGLSQSGENYAEAVDCLRSRYNRPCLIHQTHVKMIFEAPASHDTVQQHIRALKSMEYESSGAFITSVLELKLDVNTMFEWQRHSQSMEGVPQYHFIDLQAQASETSLTHIKKPTRPASC